MIRNHERDLDWKPCKIIAHAACSDGLTKTQLLDVHGACKADAVLSKPVSFDTIVKTLKELDILDKDDEIPANRLSSRRSFKEKNKKVLIAEDDVFNLDLMQKMLNSLGLESIVACNGAEAIKAFEKNRKEIQLVLMDCEMPLLDGFEATQKIAKMIEDSVTKNRIPVFGLSGHSGRIYEKKAKESGMKMLITKPISMNQLRNIFKAENIIN